jgi:hypothetical protein
MRLIFPQLQQSKWVLFMEAREYISFNLQSELSQSEFEKLKGSAWEIDCPQIIIKSRAPEDPYVIQGSGLIKQVANHQLIFKCYVNTQTGGQNTKQLQLGEKIPDEIYFDLIALDNWGRSWFCERIHIYLSKAASGSLIVQGNLLTIISRGQIQEEIKFQGSELKICVFDDITIPRNARTIIRTSIAGEDPLLQSSLNIWDFECCNLNFRLIKEENLLVVTVKSPDLHIPNYLRERICESLQFILGCPIYWAMSYERVGNSTEITLCSPKKRSNNSRFRPPIILGGYLIGEDQAFQQLFAKFLQHIIDYNQPQHPFWAQLNAIYEASCGTFIDSHALTLSVAIESLVTLEFPNLGVMTEEEEKGVKEALKYIEKWEGDTGIKNRIIGSINSYSHPSLGSKMKSLVEIGAIKKQHWDAWKAIRNKSTHSYQTHEVKDAKSIKFVNSIFQVNVLFYHLIFHAIGYEGSYMDTSVIGFPIMQYPPEKAG